jgi:separase
LQAGSAAVVASLWDVTDKDLDRFSWEMLKQWGLTEENDIPKSLTEAVAISRDSCYLKYLVGAANVAYGLPVFLKRSIPSYQELGI